MRVLVLTPKLMWPLAGGAEIRNYNLLRETSKYHEVHVLSFINNPDEDDYKQELLKLCDSVTTIQLKRPLWKKVLNGVLSIVSSKPFILREYYDKQMCETLTHIVKEKKVDVIHAHFLHVGQYVASKGSSSFVYDPHNLEHILWQRFSEVQKNPLIRIFSKLQYKKLVRWQQFVADNSEKIVTLSGVDKDLYLEISPHANIGIVPNGADIEYFSPQPIDEEENTILYFGNLSWEPQSDAAIYFYNQIFPIICNSIPNAKLYLVGNKPPQSLSDLASSNVFVTGFVDDIREYIAKASVVIMPLRVGAGTKHRIYQSLSMKKALVPTTVGAEGIDLEHEKTALIADDEEDFAENVLRVMKNKKLSEKLGNYGRELIVKHYDWRSNYKILDDVFNSVSLRQNNHETISGSLENNQPILYFGNDWSAENCTSSHQVAKQLAKTQKIIYIECPGLRSPTVSVRDFKKILKKLMGVFKGLKKINRGMSVYSLFQLPFHSSKFVRALNKKLVHLQVLRLIIFQRLKDPLLWFVVPHLAYIPEIFPKYYSVYYCVDKYSALPGVDAEVITDMDNKLTKLVGTVFVVSDTLLAEKKSINSNVHLSPHGVDFDHFKLAVSGSLPLPKDLRNISSPIIGYFGSIEAWIDLSIFTSIAAMYPDYSIVIIGHAAVDISKLEKYKNIHMLGKKDFKVLPEYAARFDVAILPYHLTDQVIHSNPIKLREYLAAGCSVVSVDFPQAHAFKNLIKIASNKSQFIKMIGEAVLDNSEEAKNNRQASVKNDTWASKANIAMSAVLKDKQNHNMRNVNT